MKLPLHGSLRSKYYVSGLVGGKTKAGKKYLVRSKMYIHMELRKRAESCLQAWRGTSKKAMARERRLMSWLAQAQIVQTNERTPSYHNSPAMFSLPLAKWAGVGSNRNFRHHASSFQVLPLS